MSLDKCSRDNKLLGYLLTSNWSQEHKYKMSGSEAVSTARKAFKSGRTLPVEWRIKQLKAMQRMVEENEVCLFLLILSILAE